MLATLMLIGTLPLSVFATEIAAVIEENAPPVVSVSSLYSYRESDPNELRALPDTEGVFFLDISLSKVPEDGGDVLVYYRTVDDSAVAVWGDYESVGMDAFVTLSRSNGYKARVKIESKILDNGFYTSDENGEKNKDKLITRRFLFELTSVQGDATLSKDESGLYCYLRASGYQYQDQNAQIDRGEWKNELEDIYWQFAQTIIYEKLGYFPGVPKWEAEVAAAKQEFKKQWDLMVKEKDDTLYYTLDDASALKTPVISIKGSYRDDINIRFDDAWKSYVQSGWCDLGISMQGKLISEYWDSDGPATLHLYYYQGGKKKLALSVYLQGEFDDSTHFGWEHAFEYAIEGNEDGNRDDHMDENFIGFTVYENGTVIENANKVDIGGNIVDEKGNKLDGSLLKEKEAYTVKIKSRSELDEIEVCGQLKRMLVDGNAVEMLSGYHTDGGALSALVGAGADTSYYLRLPSDFVLADRYCFEFISESTRTDSKIENRWLEDVKIAFTLIGNDSPMIAKDEKGNQMVTTNLDTIRSGDPLRMSVRFDRPVHVADLNGSCYITVDIYNDKGTLLAKDVKLTLKQLADAEHHYAWDTLVFEGDLPDALKGARVASLRNVQLTYDAQNGIKSFFTERELLGKSIGNIYIDKDFRTPIVTVNPVSSESFTKSKSLDVYVNTESGARFNDYVTVYYQWSNSPSTPKTYSSKIVFHTKADGEVLKTIIGTGSGNMYLHVKAVSSYGMESISDPIGPFCFDNDAPSLSASQIGIAGTMKDRTISVPLPDDNGASGLKDADLYYIQKNGEAALLKHFTADDFKGDPKTLSYTISHKDVGVGVDADGNVILERGEVEFFWVLTDKLGNASGRVGAFTLAFDTNDYIENEIVNVGPFNDAFAADTEKLDGFTFIYDASNGTEIEFSSDGGRSVAYFAFCFQLSEEAFGATDNGEYGVKITYKGEEFSDFALQGSTRKIYQVIFFTGELEPGRYDLQLTRKEGESTRVSKIHSVYVTENESDDTALKKQIEFGTLLSNTVYQLSSEHRYFYYKDANGVIQTVYYNNTKEPPTFSSVAKAKEYVYYKELSDIYLVELTSATASALISGTTGFLIAAGETAIPEAGQYWIRYKSRSWTPTSGDSAWVYYYYGESDELAEGALSANLQAALNEVANRIVGYGKTVVLTDTSLFLGSAMGDKMLDEYGMPYLVPGQIHAADELSRETMCGNAWQGEVGFAADKNIYKSKVSVGVEGDADYAQYPIVGNFALPEGSIFEYMTYEQYKSGTAAWQTLQIPKGKSFIHVFGASGVYYVREMSFDGVAVFAIYVDKEAPKVTFSNTDENGELREIPVDGKEILDIRTKDLYIGSIAPTEYDRLSYVAVYKTSNLSLVGVYTAEELAFAPVMLEDGNYYIVVSDRSGNHYTVTAKVSSTDLSCTVKESAERYIRLTCNRRADQIQRYEVYLNGELVTSTYAEDQTFTGAGLYTIYVQDIYGNEFTAEHLFVRNYPTVTWKYYGTDGKYHVYDPEKADATGFILTWVSDNRYKISTAVKTRFSFGVDYAYEFVGIKPQYSETLGTETTVTIEAGQSFTLKVFYKNHKDCYSIYTGVVDVTPPSIQVSAEVAIAENGEYALFDEWAKGTVGESIAMKDLFYVLAEITNRNVANGTTVTSDIIKINASDASALSLIEVYLDGTLIKRQDAESGFSQIIVNKWGDYRIVAKDGLGNVAEFNFTNGEQDGFDYFVDGTEKEADLHGYLNFESVKDGHLYTKPDYGKGDFKLNLKQNADVFLSVGVSDGTTEIHGFRILDGNVYPLTYKIVLDKNNAKAIDLVLGEALLDRNVDDFKLNREYRIGKDGAYAVYASSGVDQVVTIRVYAPEDLSEIVTVGARVEISGSNTRFVCAELSKKSSAVSFEGLGLQTDSDVRFNSGFVIDEDAFESERIASVQLYYSIRNDLNANNLAGKTNIYQTNRCYDEEGFYLLIVQNRYGNESVYRIAISTGFGITSSVTFADGYKIYYSADFDGTLYSDSEITLDVLDEDAAIAVTRNGGAYTGFVKRTDGGVTYLVFSDAGSYVVKLTDSYGNEIIRKLEIDQSAFVLSEDPLTGYNEKALRRDEGYTNQMLSIDRSICDREGIYYLAIRYGDTLTVLIDAFAESTVVADESSLVNAIGSHGDGVYTVILRNRYGAALTKQIHYRLTPTLRLERTTRSQSEPEAYDLDYAISLGFWSNNTLRFFTDAKTYVFTVNGSVSECPRTIVFENAGDFGSFEYAITYIDEYGFEYQFSAYLARKSVDVTVPPALGADEVDGVFNTKKDIYLTFGENVYATYTRNNGDVLVYRSGDVLKKDGTYRFLVRDYAGNATSITIKKDTAVEFSFVDSLSGNTIQNGSVVNSSKISFKDVNKDGAYIEKVIHNGIVKADFSGSKFTEDGKWEMMVCDTLGNRAYFSFYIVTHEQNGFAYTTPYEYRIGEMWYDSGDGVKVSYMAFVTHTDSTSSFHAMENGSYTVVMTSDVTGMTSTFEFTVNTSAPGVSLVGCADGETTINDVTITGHKVGDVIRVYRATKTGEELVEKVEITSLATKVPTLSEGGKYRIVVESEAGVQTELSLVRKHVMNTAGSIFVMVVIGLSVVGLFTGLIYRNKSKTDD